MEDNRTQFSAEENTMTLLQVLAVLWKRLWIIALCGVAGALLAAGVTKFAITPQYEATSTIYIFNKTTSITSLADLQIGNQLTVDFQIIAKTRDVINRVIEEQELATTYKELVEQVTVTNPKDSHMITITVRNPNPALAASISNAMAAILREQVAEVMNTDTPSMVESAIAEDEPVSPSLAMNTLVGGALFAIIAAAVVLIMELVDDSIKSEEDIERYMGAVMLAAIPHDRSMEEKRHSIGDRVQKMTRKRHHTRSNEA